MSTRLVRSTALWLIAILICLPAITGTAPAVAAAGTGADPDGHLEAAARVAHHGVSNGHSGADGAASGSDSSICDERPCPFCRDIADASDDFDRPELSYGQPPWWHRIPPQPRLAFDTADAVLIDAPSRAPPVLS